MQSRSQHRKKLEAYSLNEPHIAIFDIGTRAIRLLLGPKKQLSDWNHQNFFNASRLTNLGEDINKDMRIGTNSKGLQSIISFMNDFIPILQNHDVEIYAFGTAIFRWMKNASDTITYIKRMTGVEICILSQTQEAYMSCLALYATRNINKKDNTNVSSKEYSHLLLIDQGGGSTEISMLHINSSGELENTKLTSFDDLGSIALRDKFFMTAQDDIPVIDQYAELQTFVHKKIDSWSHFEELTTEQQKHDAENRNTSDIENSPQVLCYGMGSALSNLFPNHNYISHNQTVEIQDLNHFIQSSQERFFANNTNISIFKDNLSKMDKGVQKRFLYTCALEVHYRILKTFGFSSIRMCGYGLRYGIFVHIVYLEKEIISE